MHGHTAAAVIAREATRRGIYDPVPERSPHRPRRAAARALAAAAHRLDASGGAPRPVEA
jgi:hypothetical protein